MPDLLGPHSDIETVPAEEFVKPEDGAEHGYWGYSPETDRQQYTVAGVTKDLPGPSGTAKASDKPDSARKAALDDKTSALRGSK